MAMLTDAGKRVDARRVNSSHIDVLNKTIGSYAASFETRIYVFTDGTWFGVEAVYGMGGPDDTPELKEVTYAPHLFAMAGLMTNEEADAEVEAQQAQHKLNERTRDVVRLRALMRQLPEEAARFYQEIPHG